MRKNNKRQGYFWVVFTAGLVLRLVLSFFGTLSLDHGTFIAWSNTLAGEGFNSFYNSWSDYLPGYPYILWFLGKVNAAGIIPEELLFKLPAIIGDVLTGALIYKIISKSNEKLGLIGAALYIFNPAILANSSLWGQVDSLTALFSMLAVYLVPVSLPLSAVSLAVGTVIKPQAAFIFPVVLFLFVKNKRRLSELLLYCIIGLTVFILAFLPYWNHSTFPVFIIERLNLSLNQYPYTSVNAFNFWGLVGSWQPDNVYYQFGGYLLVLISGLFLSIKLWNRKNAEYYLMAFIFAASFTFFTRIHERHLLPVFAPLVIIAVENPLLMLVYFGFSTTYIANLYYAYYWISDNFKDVLGDFLIKLIEIFNISFVVTMFFVLAKNIKAEWGKIGILISSLAARRNIGASVSEYKFSKINLSKNRARTFLYSILIFAFAARVFNLNSPPAEYFDEVYHAFTAKVILSSEAAKAWEWWNTPPEGFAYEWTHPPLAKLGMAAGMLVFGQNSFGWRLPGALLGVGAVYLIYLLVKELFKDESMALLSAAVFSLDGLALVMSRIGMNDSYILFFILLSIYLYLKDRNFLSALAFGFALSSKWSAIWAVPIFGIIFLSQKKKLTPGHVWFFTLPFVIYILSYFDMFLTGHNLTTWWEMQQQMWWYHTGLRATHPYTSQWWSWPLLLRPIYLYTSDEIGGLVSRIYAFGNPLVFWFGIVSVFTGLYLSYVEKNKKLALIAFSYLVFFVPWAMSPRIMFLYHYLPSIPFMCIAIGYILRRSPKLIPYFLVPSAVLFIYFYPHWAGLQVPLWLDQSYYWIDTWR